MLPKTTGIFRIHTKEQKFLQDGTSIVTLNLVASSKYKTKSGQEKEDVCWITATSFGKQSEIIMQYFHEKSKIFIIGDLKQENWTSADGQKRSKHTLKIDSFDFIDRKSETNTMASPNEQNREARQNGASYSQPQQNDRQPTQNPHATQPSPQVPVIDIENQDIPF